MAALVKVFDDLLHSRKIINAQFTYVTPGGREIEEGDRNPPAGELDFTMLSRVMSGTENRSSGAAGDLMMMDGGSDQGIAAGARFAVYRDVKVGGMPLASIGEAIVVTAGRTSSVVRLTQTRDAVQIGDYLVPRK